MRRDAGCTHLSARNLALLLIPDVDVAHAFFAREWHAAHDGGWPARSLLRGSPNDLAPAAFCLQSGGCSELSLVGRFR